MFLQVRCASATTASTLVITQLAVHTLETLCRSLWHLVWVTSVKYAGVQMWPFAVAYQQFPSLSVQLPAPSCCSLTCAARVEVSVVPLGDSQTCITSILCPSLSLQLLPAPDCCLCTCAAEMQFCVVVTGDSPSASSVVSSIRPGHATHTSGRQQQQTLRHTSEGGHANMQYMVTW